MQERRLVALIQLGLLIIVAIMPFHAFLSIWLGTLTGYQSAIQAWKEVLLLLLTGLAIWLVIRDRSRLARLRQPWVITAAAFVGVALVVTAIAWPGYILAAFGIKTGLEFILAAVIALLVVTNDFLKRLGNVILIGAAIVSGFSLLQIFVLPPDFLTWFGYGPDTVVPYQRIAEGSDLLRFPSTLGGPNQLGTYLILPLCLVVARFVRERRLWQLALFAVCITSLIWTFSRSAWIGATVAICLTLLFTLPRHLKKPAIFVLGVLMAGMIALLPVLATSGGQWQYLILHASVDSHDQSHLSDSQHEESLREGTALVVDDPLGHGLGTAGPSTFHDGTPHIIENYFLQIGYEAGILGMLLFVALLVLIAHAIMKPGKRPLLAIPAAAALVGVSIVGLVLPSWVDSTTALITWIAAGAVSGTDYV